jgi:hypothetical protein
VVVRSFFLFLSRRKRLRKWMETSALAKRLATRFVAGDTLDQALAVARRAGSEGIAITLDHLGESVTSLEEAAEAGDVSALFPPFTIPAFRATSRSSSPSSASIFPMTSVAPTSSGSSGAPPH